MANDHRMLVLALKYIAKYPEEFKLYCKNRKIKADPKESRLVLSFFRKQINTAYNADVKVNGGPYNRRNNLTNTGSDFRWQVRAKGSFGG